MKMWEYRYLVDVGRETLDKMGLEGWELVSVFRATTEENEAAFHDHFYLKRPCGNKVIVTMEPPTDGSHAIKPEDNKLQ